MSRCVWCRCAFDGRKPSALVQLRHPQMYRLTRPLWPREHVTIAGSQCISLCASELCLTRSTVDSKSKMLLSHHHVCVARRSRGCVIRARSREVGWEVDAGRGTYGERRAAQGAIRAATVQVPPRAAGAALRGAGATKGETRVGVSVRLGLRPTAPRTHAPLSGGSQKRLACEPCEVSKETSRFSLLASLKRRLFGSLVLDTIDIHPSLHGQFGRV